MTPNFDLTGASFAMVPFILAVNFIVIFVLAVAVKLDADHVNARRGVFLGSPWLWFFIVLASGGYLAALGYWLIHYSSLRYRAVDETHPGEGPTR